MDPPLYSDSLEWITAYITVHSLSVPSRRYSFLLWLAVVVIFLAIAVLHWTGSRGGFLGAIWSKWCLRRRTWRKKHALDLAHQFHRQPTSLPSNAQLLSLTVLALASLALAFVGPDYLDPSLKVWQIQARAASPSQLYDTSTYESYMPQYTISKSLWSSSARVGQIAFALFPLCVLFALKAPPFAIFAIPFMIQLYFDKLAWLHKWAGRLIWLLVSIHVALWSIQLAKDVNPSTGRVAYSYAWSYTPFIYGWIAFALLTLIILLSLHPVRRRFYEHFYILHVLLVPSMLAMAGLHHPTVAWWCWAALLIWIGERLWRGTWWIYANGIVGGTTLGASPAPSNLELLPQDTWEMDHVRRSSVESTLPYLPPDGRSPSPLNAYYLHDNKSLDPPNHDKPTSQARPLLSLPHLAERDLSRTAITHLPSPYVPPPGYVHAEILSGRTVRLRLITPGFLPWSPGQHFLLCIPSVSRLTTHPFTCASVCDEEAPTDAGRIMLFLVRAKGGWTQDLWNLVSRLITERSRGDVSRTSTLPKNGILLRAYVDGPFGSAKRVRWGNYSTAVIITGGSGVSFGLSLMQYMCMCLAGRNGRHLGGRPGGWGWKGAELKRVRFIWLVREYSHLQWCASIIRRCTSTVPSSALQVDFYVTNFKPILRRHPTTLAPLRPRFDREPTKSDEELQPPHPNFIRSDATHLHRGSTESVESHESYESDVDLSYYLGESPDDEPPADEMSVAHESNMLDLTNFDGDVDVALPGEVYLSHKLRKEGKLLRMQSRKHSALGGMKQDARLQNPLATSQARTSRHVQDPRQAYSDRYTTPPSSLVPQRPKILTQSTDGLLPISLPSERPHSASSETDLWSPFSHRSDSPLLSHSPLNLVPLSSDLPSTVSVVNVHDGSRSPVYPVRSLTTNTYLHESHSAGPSTPTQGVPFQMDEREAIDVHVVSEHARPGKPKLDKLIADEVQASKGAIVVACCGPTSLNAMVRKIVAAQIDPGRVRKGDMRGSITLVSEEFEY
ncbi:hypothetical protein L210DRAFT_3391034 [Boletus edulis BED1]|uniref:ferric-chelate reductase (NADPH) n=1 Tax=Boletus edulis BED1 TaxID=1328754 RepID=A0AAD4GJ38_BOLED|nr:hypothetical protein L210DRAFT_3391034 [Boletus edulis BED1]